MCGFIEGNHNALEHGMHMCVTEISRCACVVLLKETIMRLSMACICVVRRLAGVHVWFYRRKP